MSRGCQRPDTGSLCGAAPRRGRAVLPSGGRAPCRPPARRVLTVRQKIPLICALAETTAVTSTVSTAPSPVAR